MADVPKHLGSTTSTSAANIYDNGTTAGSYTVVSSIVICNTGASSYTYTISKSTTSATHEQHLASGATINANDSVVMQLTQVLDPSCRYLVANTSNAAVRITVSGVTGP